MAHSKLEHHGSGASWVKHEIQQGKIPFNNIRGFVGVIIIMVATTDFNVESFKLRLKKKSGYKNEGVSYTTYLGHNELPANLQTVILMHFLASQVVYFKSKIINVCPTNVIDSMSALVWVMAWLTESTTIQFVPCVNWPGGHGYDCWNNPVYHEKERNEKGKNKVICPIQAFKSQNANNHHMISP